MHIPLTLQPHIKHKTEHFTFANTRAPTGPDSSVGRVSAPGGHGFDPWPRHTKVVKKGTSSLAWHSDLWGRARTGRPSVRIM